MDTEEAFANLAQATLEYRAAVNNFTDAKNHLATEVAEQANQMAANDAAI